MDLLQGKIQIWIMSTSTIIIGYYIDSIILKEKAYSEQDVTEKESVKNEKKYEIDIEDTNCQRNENLDKHRDGKSWPQLPGRMC